MTANRPKSLDLILAALPILLAGMLVLSAMQTYHALAGQREVYLRQRVATLAATLEATPPDRWPEVVEETEPGLRTFAALRAEQAPAALAPLFDGRELFRTERIPGPPPIFRAYVPFHASGELLLARLDLLESTADFLTEHAGHHLVLVAAGGLLIVVFTVLGLRAARRQAQLEHLATLGEMSAVLAHEIRNPLGTIKGFAQLLREQTGERHDVFLGPILSETSRLEALVRDLLLYGRTAQPRPEPLPAERVAETARLHLAGGAVPLQINTEDVTFRADPNLMEQIVLNLLRNALDAVTAQPAPAIRLEIFRDGRTGVVRVIDNGPGLSVEARTRLFEPFFTTKASGTGLGLSISRKLAESMGGTLSLRTANGVTVELRLPLEEP